MINQFEKAHRMVKRGGRTLLDQESSDANADMRMDFSKTLFSFSKSIPVEIMDRIAMHLSLQNDTETLIDLASMSKANYKTAIRWLFRSIELSIGTVPQLIRQLKRYSFLSQHVQEVFVFYPTDRLEMPIAPLLTQITRAHIGVSSTHVFMQTWYEWKCLKYLHLGDINLEDEYTLSKLEERPIEFLDFSALARINGHSIKSIFKACPALTKLKIDLSVLAEDLWLIHTANSFTEKDILEAIWAKPLLKRLELYTNAGASRLNLKTLCNGLNRSDITYLRITSNRLLTLEIVDLPSSLKHFEIIAYSWDYYSDQVIEFIENLLLVCPDLKFLHIQMQKDLRAWKRVEWEPEDPFATPEPWPDDVSMTEWNKWSTGCVLMLLQYRANCGHSVPDVRLDITRLHSTDRNETPSENLGGVYSRKSGDYYFFG